MALTGKLAGKAVAFAGKFGDGKPDLTAMEELTIAEGGSVVDGKSTPPDYLVEGVGPGGQKPAAVAQIQKKHPQVQIIDEAEFYRLTVPTADEFLAILKAGPHDWDFWGTIQNRLMKSGHMVDLSGRDLRKLTIKGMFSNVKLDGCDFRDATLNEAYFREIEGAKFAGATITKGSLELAKDCDFKNVAIEVKLWSPARIVRCDFTGATFKAKESCLCADECTFKNANLSGCELEESEFRSADLSSAYLSDARLQKSDFTGANLRNANFSGADLTKVTFANADLRQAKFANANLTQANFTGAEIDGADFTGATLLNVTTGEIDRSKATNFQPEYIQPPAARQPGPHLTQLEKVVAQSKEFTTSIELEVSETEFVVLKPEFRNPTVYSNFEHTTEDMCSSNGGNVQTTFDRCMIDLAVRWSHGKPRFDTIKVEAKKCPVGGLELQDLVSSAWYEALGLEAPTAEELQKKREEEAARMASLRETMLAELGGGPEGIAKWNSRPFRDRQKLGKLVKHDFSNRVLAEVMLDQQDLEGCRFDKADLKKADFGETQLKGASFVNADLSGAQMNASKCPDATFEGAVLTGCNLYSASFVRCNFQNADLTGADVSFSDLCEANLTGAKLDGVQFEEARFNEKTRFPTGFTPPDLMKWKGKGKRPVA